MKRREHATVREALYGKAAVSADAFLQLIVLSVALRSAPCADSWDRYVCFLAGTPILSLFRFFIIWKLSMALRPST